jgi:hypothetical protein
MRNTPLQFSQSPDQLYLFFLGHVVQEAAVGAGQQMEADLVSNRVQLNAVLRRADPALLPGKSFLVGARSFNPAPVRLRACPLQLSRADALGPRAHGTRCLQRPERSPEGPIAPACAC